MSPALIVSYLAAHVFWFVLFSPQTAHLLNFWIGMTIASGALALTAFVSQYKSRQKHWEFKPSHILIGLLSAVFLYAVFFFGHKLSAMLLPFAQSEVSRIYSTKTQLSPTIITLLLFFWIGPAEEIFWRGFLQERLMARLGRDKGHILATLLYTAIHAYAMNVMLLMAALICGAFWGYLYKKYGSLWPVIISHALWDVTIFVLLPIK